jgi:hypothetical protein
MSCTLKGVPYITDAESGEKKGFTISLQDGSREWITLLACVCADGSALPSGLIFHAKNNVIRSAWVDNITAKQHRIFVT